MMITDPCVICHEEMIVSREIATLKCGHKFHQPCIQRWIIDFENNTCPIDRSIINTSATWKRHLGLLGVGAGAFATAYLIDIGYSPPIPCGLYTSFCSFQFFLRNLPPAEVYRKGCSYSLVIGGVVAIVLSTRI